MRGDDRGVATVVGAIIVIGLLGLSLLYVNAYYVPRQGVALEVQTRAEAQAALLDMASRLSGGPAPFVADLPLKTARGDPPLMEGVVLSPVRVDGTLAFEPDAVVVRVSHNTTLDASVVDGVVRVANPDGATMRVYTLGNATSGRALGSVALSVGGAYLEPATLRLAGGAVFAERDSGATLLLPPALQVGQTGSLTTVAWRVPILMGALGEVGGRERAQASLVPGPVARAGSGQVVHNTTIEIVADGTLDAWRDALTAVVDCATCSVVATPDPADPESGVVVAFVGSATQGMPSVSLDYSAVRYALSLTERSAG